MTRSLTPLPAALGTHFSVAAAVTRGIAPSRLRSRDLEAPFWGVRALKEGMADDESNEATIRRQARRYSPRLRDTDFLSHSTAAAMHGAPLPLHTGARIHVSTLRPARASRARGVIGHSAAPTVPLVYRDGMRVSAPAATWAMLGDSLEVPWLVAVGDYFCRVWREGFGRPTPGRPPLATPTQLAHALESFRRLGAAKLREALPLVRVDSWSPRESLTRVLMVANGLPEPVLNHDFWTADGSFLACIDMAYPEYKVAVEYQGRVHGAHYSRDIERIDRLRAHGWIVVQVSSELFNNSTELVWRVRNALRSCGWRG